MKNMSKIMKKAHRLTKEIKAEFPSVNYKFQLGLCIGYLLAEKGENKVVELQGTEKQVKWAKDIKVDLLERVNTYKEMFNKSKDKKKYLRAFKNEILLDGEKTIKIFEAIERLNKIIDTVIINIENERSAKKIIDTKMSLRLYDSNTVDNIIRKFI